MALATKPVQQRTLPQRLWKAPLTRSSWVLLLVSLLLYGGVYAWYYIASKTTPPDPAGDPYRIFGIIAFALVLFVAGYSLRRRIVRSLPGKVENWLWMHTWFGVISILIALLHENYVNVIGYHYFNTTIFTASAGGMAALYALIILVLSGICGRLLDVLCARSIAREAGSNGVGIIQAVEAQLHTLDLLLERLCAGKSEAFKQYCMRGRATKMLPDVTERERGDLEQAVQVLTKSAILRRSLYRQKSARRIIRVWRYVHITLACLALAVICFHSITELRQMLLMFLNRG